MELLDDGVTICYMTLMMEFDKVYQRVCSELTVSWGRRKNHTKQFSNWHKIKHNKRLRLFTRHQSLTSKYSKTDLSRVHPTTILSSICFSTGSGSSVARKVSE